jgi:hypothetical protein
MHQRAVSDATNAGHAPSDDLRNDLVAIGEVAARDFVRGTKRLREHIGPMALGLAEAKRRYPRTSEFGAWLSSSSYADLNRTDRAALINLGQHWESDNLAARIAEVSSSSPEVLWSRLRPDATSEDLNSGEQDDGDEAGDSEFYGSARIARGNEAWDTIDPRLVKSLVEAFPGLKDRMVWEPAAGCGMMCDQLEAAGVGLCAATDIEPRRDDIAQLDLLTTTEMVAGASAIISNPPWGRLAAPFVRHALKLAEAGHAMVAMLLPLPWIAGRKVADLTGSVFFDALVVPRYRARWMTAAEEAKMEGGPSSPKMNHVWVVWDFARDPNLLPGIRFVDAPPEDAAADDEEIEERAE